MVPAGRLGGCTRRLPRRPLDDDDIASLRNVALIENKIAAPVETVLLHDSYHMVSVDQQRDVVIDRSVRFFQRIAASAQTTSAARARRYLSPGIEGA
jgi:hypothetical protein